MNPQGCRKLLRGGAAIDRGRAAAVPIVFPLEVWKKIALFFSCQDVVLVESFKFEKPVELIVCSR